jgi:hypothetical protein
MMKKQCLEPERDSPGSAERLLGIFGACRTDAEQALGVPRLLSTAFMPDRL